MLLVACGVVSQVHYSAVKVAIVKHFDDINEDQFDFHSYCLRKVTLRAYVSVLRFEDELFGEAYYCRAAAGIVRIYLYLVDNPISTASEEPDYSKMSAAERKKAKAIARKKKKAAEKKESELQQKRAENENGAKNKNQKGGKPQVIDKDPLGKELLEMDPLDEARKYASILARYAPNNLESWILQYDVADRRKKPLMALQALYKARSIDPESGELFTRLVDFGNKFGNIGDVSAVVKEILDEETPRLFDHQTVSEFIKSTASSIRAEKRTRLPLRTAVARALVETKTASVTDAVSLITEGGMECGGVTIVSCQDALRWLRSFGPEGEAAVEEWKSTVLQRFPRISLDTI